jgi:hypothetical protein
MKAAHSAALRPNAGCTNIVQWRRERLNRHPDRIGLNSTRVIFVLGSSERAPFIAAE